jgi:acetyl esterase/lipase
VRLHEGTAPGSEDWVRAEVEYLAEGARHLRNVVDPGLTVLLPAPATATGAAVVIAPGGAFCWLSWDTEGLMVGEWLRRRGIAAFVLKYRTADMGADNAEFEANAGEVIDAMLALAKADDPAELRRLRYPALSQVIGLAEDDARQAIRHVRGRAAGYGVAPDRIGLMGFSAGGIVTMSLAMHHDEQTRPDFVVPVYGIAHEHVVVPEDAPPMFLVCALDDELIVPHASQLFDAWRTAGKVVESHVYSQGGHGFGLRGQGLPVDTWIERFREWLDANAFLTTNTPEPRG